MPGGGADAFDEKSAHQNARGDFFLAIGNDSSPWTVASGRTVTRPRRS